MMITGYPSTKFMQSLQFNEIVEKNNSLPKLEYSAYLFTIAILTLVSIEVSLIWKRSRYNIEILMDLLNFSALHIPQTDSSSSCLFWCFAWWYFSISKIRKNYVGVDVTLYNYPKVSFHSINVLMVINNWVFRTSAFKIKIFQTRGTRFAYY